MLECYLAMGLFLFFCSCILFWCVVLAGFIVHASLLHFIFPLFVLLHCITHVLSSYLLSLSLLAALNDNHNAQRAGCVWEIDSISVIDNLRKGFKRFFFESFG